MKKTAYEIWLFLNPPLCHNKPTITNDMADNRSYCGAPQECFVPRMLKIY